MKKAIRVLCADDNDISIQGMSRILGNEEDIILVGQINKKDEIIKGVLERNPDILILDLKWDGDFGAGRRILKQIKENNTSLKIIAITAFDFLVREAMETGADSAVSKEISAYDLIELIRKLVPEGTRMASITETLNQLNKLPIGSNDDAKKHEEYVFDILQFCLKPDLTNWQMQVTTFSQLERPDIMCSNFSQKPFWATMRQIYEAQQIVFQLKNTDKLKKEHLGQIALSLGRKRGMFGFLVARRSLGKRFWKSLYLPYERLDQAILYLVDSDLTEMVQLKMKGGDPTEIIEHHYNEFIRPISGSY